VTEHKGTFAGKELSYQAKAGNIPLTKDDGTVRANVFYVAYTLSGEIDPTKRPVTFCFNGGPGSSAVWLHLGAFGPKRVDIPEEGTGFPVPPFSLVDNPDSLLPATDLVFIDPVSTGYSRPEKAEPKEFYNFEGDIQAVADFIRLYVTRNARWGSPKFLAGESYGAIRATGLTSPLQSRQGMYLNGVILVSGLLDFETLSGGDTSNIVYLPSMTAVAHFHKKLPPDLQADLRKAVETSRTFALGPYATALLQGDQVDGKTKAAVAEEFARLTGLKAEDVLRAHLRPGPTRFRKLLLQEEGAIIGRFDGRVRAEEPDADSSWPSSDPSLDNVYGAYSTLLNDYIRRELGYESDLSYEILAGLGWSYDKFTNRYLDVGGQLTGAFQSNPHFRLFIACGWHDLATPPEGIRHSVDALQLPKKWKDQITYGYYEGGHMMYTRPASLAELNRDISRMIGEASAR
jgi:carboxypeptidase C (cathepsin A)